MFQKFLLLCLLFVSSNVYCQFDKLLKAADKIEKAAKALENATSKPNNSGSQSSTTHKEEKKDLPTVPLQKEELIIKDSKNGLLLEDNVNNVQATFKGISKSQLDKFIVNSKVKPYYNFCSDLHCPCQHTKKIKYDQKHLLGLEKEGEMLWLLEDNGNYFPIEDKSFKNSLGSIYLTGFSFYQTQMNFYILLRETNNIIKLKNVSSKTLIDYANSNNRDTLQIRFAKCTLLECSCRGGDLDHVAYDEHNLRHFQCFTTHLFPNDDFYPEKDVSLLGTFQTLDYDNVNSSTKITNRLASNSLLGLSGGQVLNWAEIIEMSSNRTNLLVNIYDNGHGNAEKYPYSLEGNKKEMVFNLSIKDMLDYLKNQGFLDGTCLHTKHYTIFSNNTNTETHESVSKILILKQSGDYEIINLQSALNLGVEEQVTVSFRPYGLAEQYLLFTIQPKSTNNEYTFKVANSKYLLYDPINKNIIKQSNNTVFITDYTIKSIDYSTEIRDNLTGNLFTKIDKSVAELSNIMGGLGCNISSGTPPYQNEWVWLLKYDKSTLNRVMYYFIRKSDGYSFAITLQDLKAKNPNIENMSSNYDKSTGNMMVFGELKDTKQRVSYKINMSTGKIE